MPGLEYFCERLFVELDLRGFGTSFIGTFASQNNLICSQEPGWMVVIRSVWEDDCSENGDWESNATADDEQPSPPSEAIDSIKVGIASTLEVPGEHLYIRKSCVEKQGLDSTYSSQGTGDVKETQSTRNLRLLVPASNTVNDPRVCHTFENTTEEPDDIDMFDVLHVRRQES